MPKAPGDEPPPGADAAPDGVAIREATPGDRPAVATVVDAAMLQVEDLGARIASGDALVAVADGRVLGALVLDPAGPGPAAELPACADENTCTHVAAVAVRRRRRGRGVGTALVTAAAAREGRLTAGFDPAVRPFYESLGAEIREGDDGGGAEGSGNGDRRLVAVVEP